MGIVCSLLRAYGDRVKVEVKNDEVIIRVKLSELKKLDRDVEVCING